MILNVKLLQLNSSDDRRRREVRFTNIQKHLIERGVDLRRTYPDPDIYSKLCNYVENDQPFLPVTIYPKNVSVHCLEVKLNNVHLQFLFILSCRTHGELKS
jgi:hypothetical protein